MKKTFILLSILVTIVSAQVKFDNYFYDKTMRMDYYHVGTHDSEYFIFDQLIEEPYFAGSKKYLVDTLNYGNHFYIIVDSASNKIIYSRGFSSLFQEWQATDEAKLYERAFTETVVFPFPMTTAFVELYSRKKNGEFEMKLQHKIDPDSYFISKEKRKEYPSEKIRYSGDRHKKLDIVFIPEGYTQSEMEDFKNDCNKYAEYLFKYEPFTTYKNEINIWSVLASSEDSGADIPGDTVWVNSVVNSSFYTFDSERYLMTTDMKSVRDVASNAPYDQIIILVNSKKYGGGGIYNYYSLTVTKHPASEKVFIHEFAHGLAGLADEYGADETYIDYYVPDVEPWEPNITTLVDFDSKWKNLVDESTPIPTPDEEKYYYVIGAFEGAGYVNEGVYRPTHNSLMRTLAPNEFNLVSKLALEKVIKTYLD